MFRKLLVGLAVTVVALGTQVETAKAEVKVKVLTSVTGAGVVPGYTVKPGVITPVAGFYPSYSYYPTYPAYYPVIPVAPVHVYTVLYKAGVHHPFAVYGSYRSHSLAHEVADSLRAAGYHARVSH